MHDVDSVTKQGEITLLNWKLNEASFKNLIKLFYVCYAIAELYFIWFGMAKTPTWRINWWSDWEPA